MPPQTEVQLVLLRVEGETYGIEIERLTEVVQLPHLRRVPRAPRYVVGIMHLRGRIVPVLDLRLRIGLDTPARHPEQVAVAVSHGVEAGIAVDAVEEIARVPFAQIRPAEDGAFGPAGRSIAGVAEISGRFVRVLDLDLAVSPQEMEMERADMEVLEPG